MITIFQSRGFYVIKIIKSREMKNKSFACSVHDGVVLMKLMVFVKEKPM